MMKIKLQYLKTAFAFLFLGFTVIGNAQFTEQNKIVGDYRESRAEFGTSVDFIDNYIAVGASRESIATGAVYIYKMEGENIEFHQKLTAFDGAEMAEFGGIVRFVEDQLIVASGRANIGDIYMAGALYIYDLNEEGQWVFNSKIVASEVSGSDLMGANPTCLDTFGNTIAVGAMAYDNWKGAVYIFEKTDNEWIETQKIENPDGIEFGNFGIGVSIFENYMVIGASGVNNRAGKAYIFKRNEENGFWEYEHNVMASDAQNNIYFGTSVSINGNQFVVGAYAEESMSSNIPAAYIFEQNISGEWREVQRIGSHEAGEDTYFGWDCEMKNDMLFIAAPHVFGLEESRVNVYKRNENGLWDEFFTVIPSDNFNAFFGWHFAYHGDKLLVGAPRNNFDENGENEINDAGAAFMFKQTTLGFEEISNQNSITLYPNPATDFLNIASPQKIDFIEIFDLAGQKIQIGNQSQINISHLHKGIYVIRITLENGKTETHKWLKK